MAFVEILLVLAKCCQIPDQQGPQCELHIRIGNIARTFLQQKYVNHRFVELQSQFFLEN